MFAGLPDLTPRDSHSLWYTSARTPIPGVTSDPSALDPSVPPTTSRRQNQAALERTALARLRADEVYQERRKHNISNFGATWLKPPGVTKSLFQMREERREQEEHAEALRREQLAQQLADAEAAEAGGETAVGGELELDGEAMRGEEAGEERDLDDEIPDAEGFGFDGVESDGQESDASSHGDYIAGPETGRAARRELEHVRANEDRVRGILARGQGNGPDMYGADEEIDDEDQAQMLEEDDLVHGTYPDGLSDDQAMDMEANLDDDIPEAEAGEYEHTDSEAELSSDGDGAEPSFVVSGPSQRQSRFRSSLARSDRNSLDISSFLSRDGSSNMGSSPHGRRRG